MRVLAKFKHDALQSLQLTTLPLQTVVMALMITANMFQAMFSSFLWLMSILFSATHRDWVYGCRNLLVLCHTLLVCIFVLTILGVGLGIWAKLAPYWPEVAISLSFLLIVIVYGLWAVSNLVAEQVSLEYYHFPLWFKLFILVSRYGACCYIPVQYHDLILPASSSPSQCSNVVVDRKFDTMQK